MKKNILKITLLVALLALGVYGYLETRYNPIKTVTIADQRVTVTTVSSPEDLSRGLAGVQQLSWDQGMLFLFPRQGTYTFWMKDMVMPIDIIWMRGNLVADITRNVPPPSDLAQQDNLPLYTSREAIDSVLEVRSGFADRYNIKIGQTVQFGT